MSFFVLLHRLNLPNSESCPIAMGLGFETDFFFSVGTLKLAEKVWGKGKEETDRNWVFLPDSLHCVFHRIIEWWRL